MSVLSVISVIKGPLYPLKRGSKGVKPSSEGEKNGGGPRSGRVGSLYSIIQYNQITAIQSIQYNPVPALYTASWAVLNIFTPSPAVHNTDSLLIVQYTMQQCSISWNTIQYDAKHYTAAPAHMAVEQSEESSEVGVHALAHDQPLHPS